MSLETYPVIYISFNQTEKYACFGTDWFLHLLCKILLKRYYQEK